MTEPHESTSVPSAAAIEPEVVSLPSAKRLRIVIGVLVLSLAANGVLAWLAFGRSAASVPVTEVQLDMSGRPVFKFHVDPESGLVLQGDYLAPDGKATARWFDRDADGRWDRGEASCGRVMIRCDDPDGDGCCERYTGIRDGKEIWTSEDTDGDGMVDVARRGGLTVRDVDQDGFLDFEPAK